MHLTGRRRTLALYVGVLAVLTKILVSGGALPSAPAVTVMAWFASLTFAAVGVVLVATETSVASGWLCLGTAWGTVLGDLNATHWPVSLSSFGYVFEPIFLVAAVALCLTYPGPLRPAAVSIAVGLMVFVVCTRAPLVFLDGPLSDGFWHPEGWGRYWAPGPHDALVRAGRFGTGLALIGVAAVLLSHIWRTRGLARQALASLSFLGGITALGAAFDQMVWVSDELRGTVTFGGDVRNMAGALLPMALLAHLLRRQAARAEMTETVLVAARTGDLRAVESALATVLADPTVRLLLPSESGSWRPLDGVDLWRDPSAPRASCDISADSGAQVRIEYDPRALGDPSLLAPVGKALELGMDNAQLADEVQAHLRELEASRSRLASAALQERRRVERDLHDGAQQSLLAVVTKLAMADLVTDDQLRSVIGDARHQLGMGIAELRDLARGIYPANLVQGGLKSALGDLVGRAGPAVTLTLDEPIDRLAPEIEATAYFLVGEALTNCHRHAPQAAVTVWVTVRGGTLLLAVTDDGPGGVDESAGSGLTGIRDRVAAVGGDLVIHSDPCSEHPHRSGVRLDVSMPVEPLMGEVERVRGGG
ncbi:MAG TPA: histidine kinase [Dermatophilaceae bacterium]|nr:histidine kinase [Dermatophilaceae bacterium]